MIIIILNYPYTTAIRTGHDICLSGLSGAEVLTEYPGQMLYRKSHLFPRSAGNVVREPTEKTQILCKRGELPPVLWVRSWATSPFTSPVWWRKAAWFTLTPLVVFYSNVFLGTVTVFKKKTSTTSRVQEILTYGCAVLCSGQSHLKMNALLQSN